MITSARSERALSEQQFQARITTLCDWLRLTWHHETDSRKSKAGFPDLVICGPGGLIFTELKTDKGKLSLAQAEWINALRLAGARAYVWRPSDWPEIQKILHQLAGR